MDGMRRSFTLVAAVGASTLAILYYYNKHRQQQQQNADNFSFSHLLDRTEDVGDVTTEVTTHDTTSSSSEDVTVTANDTEINQSTGFEDTVVDESKVIIFGPHYHLIYINNTLKFLDPPVLGCIIQGYSKLIRPLERKKEKSWGLIDEYPSKYI